MSYFKGRNFLVTGGTGFIGSALVTKLLSLGANVRSLDNNSRGNNTRLANVEGNLECLEGDIRDLEVVRRAVKGMDTVCHLAYINGTEYFYTKPELILDVGVKGMLNVIDACIECGIGDLVLASSSEVYQTPPAIPTDESAPLIIPDVFNPRYSYGGGKIISELLLACYGRNQFERTIIFRPHNVYGPDMGGEHVIPQFAKRMKDLCAKNDSGKIEFPIQGNGKETRAFVYIDDFTAGLECILKHGKSQNIYHIGTDVESSIAEVAKLVASNFDREIEIKPGDLLPGSTLRRCPDITKLRALGFEPKISLEEGISNTVSWYQNH